ncbi:MAG: CobD/CbiB family cobalamin biosynthesis protein, partial [Spirochaetota bacterium]|nr:CobD/CbiB family cobalamin biosynthesis protein [Spirochaetota bacterium]
MMAYQLIAAYLLDIIFGDPHSFPHPVRYIGRSIEFLEIKLRKTGLNLRICGAILAFVIILSTYTIICLILHFLSLIDYWIGIAVSIFFIYTSISVKSLADEGINVFNLICEGSLNKAREQLSMIVGRDTQDLNESEIIRATVETVAESVVDGV